MSPQHQNRHCSNFLTTLFKCCCYSRQKITKYMCIRCSAGKSEGWTWRGVLATSHTNKHRRRPKLCGGCGRADDGDALETWTNTENIHEHDGMNIWAFGVLDGINTKYNVTLCVYNDKLYTVIQQSWWYINKCSWCWVRVCVSKVHIHACGDRTSHTQHIEHRVPKQTDLELSIEFYDGQQYFHTKQRCSTYCCCFLCCSIYFGRHSTPLR